RDRILGCDGLLVADRDVVGEEGDVDIGLADEQCFHDRSAHGGPSRQTSSAYSRMTRSDENQPICAVLRMLARHQAAGSRQRSSTARCARQYDSKSAATMNLSWPSTQSTSGWKRWRSSGENLPDEMLSI